MKTAAAILAALALAAPATPQASGTARWQRILTPPQGNPTAEQCIVVDADLYAHAAPGLRDVRLIQDNAELPYAMDVSFDTRVGESAPPPADDRAAYEAVMVVPLVQQPSGDGGAGKPDTWFNEALLSAHVPIERIRLDPAPTSTATIELHAAARMNLRDSEDMRASLTASAPSAPFTIGANLQEAADILVRVHESGSVPRAVILEMRRREICYRPRTASPIRLVLGDSAALPARYDYALHFQPSATPLLASMGPMSTNPNFREQPAAGPVFHSSAGLRIAVTLVIFAGSLAVLAFAVYELRRP